MTIRHLRILLSTVALLLLIGPSISAESVELPAPLKGVYEGQPPRSLADLKLMESHQQKLAELTIACTVGIRVGTSQGSGVIISEDGYILTAAHVAGRPKVPCAIILPMGRSSVVSLWGSIAPVTPGWYGSPPKLMIGAQGIPHRPMKTRNQTQKTSKQTLATSRKSLKNSKNNRHRKKRTNSKKSRLR